MRFDSVPSRWFTWRRVLLLAALLSCSPALTEAPAQGLAPLPVEPAPGSPTLRSQWLQELRTLAVQQLTVALQRAYRQHIAAAQPLPAEVRDFLAPLFPAEVLERARYTVSKDEITLPGVLNQGSKALFGQDHAVSIDHLIIFSRDPGLARASDAQWWAHELGHHLQYQRLGGIAGFAEAYVANFAALEAEAEAWGQQAVQKYIDEVVWEREWQRPATPPAALTQVPRD
ncbi:MAG: hypothetical protein RBS88_00640 [Spongiibacteraceae bacterium]|jgi:hypothetical protein|nr:hypothetical protein [Spongiibacteraceae bacterium]